MSTPSLAPAQSLSTVSGRVAAIIAAAVAAIVVVVVVLALNTGTAQSNLPSPVNATPVKHHPHRRQHGAGLRALSYRHSFAGHR